MKRGFAAMGATLLALLASSFVHAAPAYGTTGMRVQNGRLVEANGHDLVLRGINHAYGWYANQTGAFSAIKAAGANSIRLSLVIGHRWKPANTVAEVATAISLCKQNRLICILDAHDTIGYGQQEGAATIDQAAEYWLSIRSALVGQENYVILNVADEPFGYKIFSTWAADTSRAIRRLRAAGFQHTLMVDAPGWGQDESFAMRDNAPQVLAVDPTGNTVFDVHMYGMFDTPAKVRSYLHSFVNRRLPIVVGEFSSDHPYGKPAVDAVLQYSQAYRLGYLGWSWSGNTEAAYLDMVKNFNPSIRTPWGIRFLSGVNGLRTNVHEATVFGRAVQEGTAKQGTTKQGTTQQKRNRPALWPQRMTSESVPNAPPARPFPSWPASPGPGGASAKAPDLAKAFGSRDDPDRADTGRAGSDRAGSANAPTGHPAWAFRPR